MQYSRKTIEYIQNENCKFQRLSCRDCSRFAGLERVDQTLSAFGTMLVASCQSFLLSLPIKSPMRNGLNDTFSSKNLLLVVFGRTFALVIRALVLTTKTEHFINKQQIVVDNMSCCTTKLEQYETTKNDRRAYVSHRPIPLHG